MILVKQFNVTNGFQCDIVDPAGVDQIRVNGKAIEFSKDSKVSLHLKAFVSVTMKLKVFDSLGNSTDAQYHIQDFNHHSGFTAMNTSHSVHMSDSKGFIDVNKLDISLSPHLSECTAYENYIDLKGKAKSNLCICDLIIEVRHAHSKTFLNKA
ncbi:MAG: hypothetical protein OMM_14353, partial [Candidatus Magnetoglobus multicellularis str. Araruama]